MALRRAAAPLALLALLALGGAPARAVVLGAVRKPQAAQAPAPAQAVQQLDAVEEALHRVEAASLSPEQKKAANHTVQEVERVLAELKGDTKLSKQQRQAKVMTAIQDLQGLQSQWQLSTVEAALKQVVDNPRLSAKQVASAKKVVAEVDAVVEDIQAGKLKDKAAQNKKVAFAIKELEGLQQMWVNGSATASHLEELEQQLVQKKALLAKDEKELKLANLEKQLVEKKAELSRLVAEQRAAEAQQKDREEEAAQQAMVGQLLASAKALAGAGSKGNATVEAKKDVVKKEDAKEAAIKGIVASLQAQAKNVSESIKRMDADEQKREKQLETSMKAPTTGKKDALAKGQALLKMLIKKSKRTFQKARAAREAELQELNDGIQSVQKGDVKALARIMSKMESESKSLQAKSKNFLH